jgi:hypothetical protein
MKRVKLLDSAWLLLEKPETPMHVGILMRFHPCGIALGFDPARTKTARIYSDLAA